MLDLFCYLVYVFNDINFPLSTLYCIAQILISCVILFSLKYLKFFPEISFLNHVLFINVFSLYVFWHSNHLSVIPSCSENRQYMIYVLLHLLRCVLWPRIWSTLKRVCILLLMDEIVYRCPLYPIDWWYCWVPLHPSYVLPDLFISHGGALESLTVRVASSISPCNFLSFCFMQFSALVLGMYPLRIIISSWRIDPFIT